MDFYYGRMSGNSARVAFALAEAHVEHTAKLVDTRAGANRAADYLAVNPMGKVPALVDDKLVLWESNAINLYLAETHPRLLPPTRTGRARMHQWLFFQAAHVSPACITVFRGTNPRIQSFWGTSADAAAVDAARRELARFLPVLDEALAGDAWLAGAFSLADIAHAPHLHLAAESGFDLAPYPHLAGWLGRIRSRPSWQIAEQLIFSELR